MKSNSNRRFKIVIIESDKVSVEEMGLDDLMNVKPNGQDYEYMYALNDILDQILDLKQFEKMTFQWNRDNPDTLGIVLRWK